LFYGSKTAAWTSEAHRAVLGGPGWFWAVLGVAPPIDPATPTGSIRSNSDLMGPNRI